jgi:hypothetical protein
MKNKGDTLELKTNDGMYGEFLVHELTYRFRNLDVRFKIHDKFLFPFSDDNSKYCRIQYNLLLNGESFNTFYLIYFQMF